MSRQPATRFRVLRLATALVSTIALAPSAAHAGDVDAFIPHIDTPGQLDPSDDGSSGPVDIGFTVEFFGTEYDQLYVNNNGNVTFGGPLSAYTPFGLNGTSSVIIAPFFADVDTRNGGTVSYGSGTIDFGSSTSPDQHKFFLVTWKDVDYFNSQAANHVAKDDRFQLLLVDRSEISPGDFDIAFAYKTIGWETGDASGGTNGFGGSSAHAGYSNGSGAPGTSFELPGSGIPGSLVDGGPTALASNSLGFQTPMPGVYGFKVRAGVVAAADLSIGITTSAVTLQLGDTVTYTVTVGNRGPVASSSSEVADGPIAGLTDFQGNGPGASCTGGTTLQCTLPTLAKDATTTLTITAKVATQGNVINTVSVVGREPDPDPTDNTASVGLDVSTCQGAILSKSTPRSVTFTPKKRKAAKKQIKLAIINSGTVPVYIHDVSALPGQPFVVTGLNRKLPQKIAPEKGKVFYVHTAVGAGEPSVLAQRPYFSIGFSCQP